jgi:hypothetical protein
MKSAVSGFILAMDQEMDGGTAITRCFDCSQGVRESATLALAGNDDPAGLPAAVGAGRGRRIGRNERRGTISNNGTK